MKVEHYTYCKVCSEKILNEWKGWPKRDKVPELPRIICGECEVCKGTNELHSQHITWLNYHSEFSTGLPDYWLLRTDQPQNKWGLPYYCESECPRCKGRSIVSQHGTNEMCHNCAQCGVIKIRERLTSYKKKFPHGYPDKKPQTVEQAIDILNAILTDSQKTEIANTEKDEMISYHFGLGMWVRNNFGLWEGDTKLLNALDHSHPDDASGELIERYWKTLQDTKYRKVK